MDRRANRTARAALDALPMGSQASVPLALAAYTELSPTPLARYALEASLANGSLPVIYHSGVVVSLAFDSRGRLAEASDTNNTVSIRADVGLPDRFLDIDGCPAAVAYGPRDQLATVTRDGSLQIWDGEGTTPRATVALGRSRVAMTYLANGDLAIGCGDGTVRLLDDDLQPTVVLDDGARHGPVLAVAAAGAGGLAAGFGDGSALVWDAHGRVAHRLVGHRDAVFAIAVGACGRVATGGRDGRILTWHSDGRLAAELATSTNLVTALGYARDGCLAAGFDSGEVRVWAADGRLVHLLTDLAEPVSALAFAGDGRLAVAGRDRTVHAWDVGGRLVATVAAEGATALGFLPDGRLALGTPHRPVTLVDPAGTATADLPGATATAALAVSGDGRLAAAGGDGLVRVWDRSGGDEPRILAGHRGAVTAVMFTADGRVASAGPGGVTVWGADGTAMALTGDAARVIAPGPDGSILIGLGDRLMRAHSLEPERLAAIPAELSALATATDGRIAVGCANGAVEMLDATGTLSRRDVRSTSPIVGCAFAPDGRLAAGSADGEVRLWDADGAPLHALPERAERVDAIAFAGDGRLAVSHGRLVRIWPSGTPAERLLALAGRYPREALTAQQREEFMLTPVPAGGD